MGQTTRTKLVKTVTKVISEMCHFLNYQNKLTYSDTVYPTPISERPDKVMDWGGNHLKEKK